MRGIILITRTEHRVRRRLSTKIAPDAGSRIHGQPTSAESVLSWTRTRRCNRNSRADLPGAGGFDPASGRSRVVRAPRSPSDRDFDAPNKHGGRDLFAVQREAFSARHFGVTAQNVCDSPTAEGLASGVYKELW
jgi:hypothetical protein